MGWKISVIISDWPNVDSVADVAKRLDLNTANKEADLSVMLFPDTMHMGKFGKNLIVSHDKILGSFFGKNPSEYERRVITALDCSRVIAISQIENAGITGFSYIRNSHHVRTFLFGEEEGEIINFGEKLPEEHGVNPFDLPWEMPRIILGERFDSDAVLATRMTQYK